MSDKLFCKGGGCTAKLGAGVLSRVLSALPRGQKDENLLIGYDSKDDAAVYQITPDQAVVQTLDFFPPMVEDPYLFGQIAATNALSDIYAMGGEVITALNIVCFPQSMDLNILGEIMRGGSEKVIEAGGSLVGGHSINDTDVKYGLSVMGLVNPAKMYANNRGLVGDQLIFTKKLGTGLVCNGYKVGEVSEEDFQETIKSMTTLNKMAAKISQKYKIHACTDVTGFSLCGHLYEMIHEGITAVINSDNIQALPGALYCAGEFLYTAAGQRNRNHVGDHISFAKEVSFAMQELLFDPQTSGGLLFALPAEEAEPFLQELMEAGLPASHIGSFIEKKDKDIYVV